MTGHISVGVLGRSARLCAIVKGGLHLETRGRVDTVVLDAAALTFLVTRDITSIISVIIVARPARGRRDPTRHW